MSDFIDSFSMSSQYTITDEGFNLDDSPSINTDGELGDRFKTNLGLVQNNTRVATSLEELSQEEEEIALRKFIHNLIMKKGMRGQALVNTLHRVYESSFLTSHKKLIASYTKRDYLIGNVYDDLSPYDTCVPLKSNIKRSSAQLIVKCGECDTCPYKIKNHCGAYGKDLVDSSSQVDYVSVAKSLGLTGEATVININGHLKTSAETLQTPSVKKSGHTVYRSNLKKESEYNLKSQIKKFDPSKLNWDQLKKASKVRDTKKLLNFFIKRNIQAGTLNYERMFKDCDVSDLRKHKPFLRKIAYKYLAEDSIFGEVIDFYELPSLNRRLPTSTQDESQWYTLRADEEVLDSNLYVRGDSPNKKKSSIDPSSVGWNTFKSKFPEAQVRDVLDHYILSRVTANTVDLGKMFSGSDPVELRDNVKDSTKRTLKKYKGFRSFFNSSLGQDTIVSHKKGAGLDSSLPYANSGQSGDVMKSVVKSSGRSVSELDLEFSKILQLKNLNKAIKFVSSKELNPKELSSLVKLSVNRNPKVKTLCYQLLTKLGVFKEVSKKTASKTKSKSTTNFSELSLDSSTLEESGESLVDIIPSAGVIL